MPETTPRGTCGIYLITNTVNGHRYVGLSRCIENRFAFHFAPSKLRRLTTVLARAARKYGRDVFALEVLEVCSVDKLPERERFWIRKLRPEYNMNEGGLGNTGREVSPETRAILSVRGKEQWSHKSEAERIAFAKANLRRPALGHVVAAETRSKLSAALSGRSWTHARRSACTGCSPGMLGNTNGNKRVTAVSLRGSEAMMFNSAKESASYFGVRPESISVILRRGGLSRRIGFYFETIHNN